MTRLSWLHVASCERDSAGEKRTGAVYFLSMYVGAVEEAVEKAKKLQA
jgi:hypothetical protein